MCSIIRYKSVYFIYVGICRALFTTRWDDCTFSHQNNTGIALCSWPVTGVNYLLRNGAIFGCRLSCGEVRGVGRGWDVSLCLWIKRTSPELSDVLTSYWVYVIQGFQLVQHERFDLHAKQIEKRQHGSILEAIDFGPGTQCMPSCIQSTAWLLSKYVGTPQKTKQILSESWWRILFYLFVFCIHTVHTRDFSLSRCSFCMSVHMEFPRCDTCRTGLSADGWMALKSCSVNQVGLWLKYNTGGWVGTFFMFPYIGNNHPNRLSYFSEGLKPPTR